MVNPMKKFKELIIHIGDESTAINELVNIENACVIPEFKYDEEVEKMYMPDDKMAHLLVTLPGLPQAVLLAYVSDGDIKVINIVPFNKSTFRIEVEEYNAIVDAFNNKIVQRVIGDRFRVEVTSGEYTLQEVIPKSYDALVKWTKSPGAPLAPFSHQLDLERWFEFLSQMTINEEYMESGKLEQWLREVIEWPDIIIDETILKYEEELDLLDYYVNRRNHK